MGTLERLGLTTLVAYADGELEAEDAAAVEAHLSADADARDIVRKLRQSALLLRAAHDPVAAEPVPPALVETVLRSPASPDMGSGARLHRSPSPSSPIGQVAAMVALLVVGLGGGFGFATYSNTVAERAELTAGEALQARFAATRDQALETMRSGTPMTWTSPDGKVATQILPIRTTYSAENGYCREYQRTTNAGAESVVVHGVACRTDTGAWRPRYELVKNAEIEAISSW